MASDPTATSGRTAITAVGLAVVSILAFLPALATGFTSDDFFILSRVKTLDGLADPWAYFRFGFFDYYRPAGFLTHAMDWQLWGPHAFGFHLSSLLLHAANTLLVFAIGRRLLTFSAAVAAALLFALHPASHEVVYWIAARFDLLATFFTLVAVWCLADERRAVRAGGVIAFALGLLSKESAVSLVMIAPAWDAFVARRPLREVAWRALPLAVVLTGYAVVRSLGADLDAVGGSRRLPKLMMVVAALAVIGWTAWRRERQPSGVSDRQWLPWWLAAAIGALVGAALWGPDPIAAAIAKGLGASAYEAYYLLSPIVFPPPPTRWFEPVALSDALPGLIVVCGALAGIVVYGRVIARHAPALFLCVFTVAALLPVSSMTGGLRYLYLATVGVSLLAGWLLQLVPRRGRVAAAALVAAVLALSLTQVIHAGRAWRAGSEMTRAGVKLMATSLQPCGTKDVLLLTAPVGIGGVYANINYESFDVLEDCSPRTFFILLRVVDRDVHVDLMTTGNGDLELRIPNYSGNVVASADLSAFTVQVTPGLTQSIETRAGLLHTFPEGTTQVFRISLNPAAQAAARFYYTNGSIQQAVQ